MISTFIRIVILAIIFLAQSVFAAEFAGINGIDIQGFVSKFNSELAGKIQPSGLIPARINPDEAIQIKGEKYWIYDFNIFPPLPTLLRIWTTENGEMIAAEFSSVAQFSFTSEEAFKKSNAIFYDTSLALLEIFNPGLRTAIRQTFTQAFNRNVERKDKFNFKISFNSKSIDGQVQQEIYVYRRGNPNKIYSDTIKSDNSTELLPNASLTDNQFDGAFILRITGRKL